MNEDDLKILDIIRDNKCIIVLNKIDLKPILESNNENFTNITSNIVEMSALNREGLDKLYDEITKMFNLNEINLDNEIMITNLRDKNLIDKSIFDINDAKKALKDNMPIDIVAIYIKNILEELGNITGDNVTEDIINEIFSKFCLGK